MQLCIYGCSAGSLKTDSASGYLARSLVRHRVGIGINRGRLEVAGYNLARRFTMYVFGGICQTFH